MANVQLSLASERWLDEVLLLGQKTDVDGASDDLYLLPTTLGDIAVIEINAIGFAAATAITLANNALHASVVSSDGSTRLDIIGVEPWLKTGALRFEAYISPDPLVLVRQSERINLLFEELDSNVAPTIDFNFYIKAVRVRPQEGAPAPLRLVR